MRRVKNIATHILIIVMCMFICVGYAATSDNLYIDGSADVEALVLPDVYITEVTPDSSAGVTVSHTNGTVLFASVSGSGTATFKIDVINISDKIYTFDRVIDGAELQIEGVYSGSDITYEVSNLAKPDEIASNGGTLSFYITITVPEGVTAENYILKFNFIEKDKYIDDSYFPEEMPEGEVSLVQRLSNILNNRYTTDVVTDARDYLINETIQVRWEPGAWPYVGSMDDNYEYNLDQLFGDVLMDTGVSFILKNEDLNWDGFSEIALYSTSDPLDSTSEWPDGVVCVYITVFTPVIDEQKNIIGYNMVCEAMRGYCCEVRYGTDDLTPSFSTDHWRDDVGYWYYDEQTYSSYECAIPEGAMSEDGSKEYRYDYNSYNRSYKYGEYSWGATVPFGNRLWQCLDGKIPWLY